jgi:hypothetical protein
MYSKICPSYIYSFLDTMVMESDVEGVQLAGDLRDRCDPWEHIISGASMATTYPVVDPYDQKATAPSSGVLG